MSPVGEGLGVLTAGQLRRESRPEARPLSDEAPAETELLEAILARPAVAVDASNRVTITASAVAAPAAALEPALAGVGINALVRVPRHGAGGGGTDAWITRVGVGGGCTQPACQCCGR